MTTLERTREFFAAGGTLLSGKRRNVAKALAGLGVAAVVAVLPYPAGDGAPPSVGFANVPAKASAFGPEDSPGQTVGGVIFAKLAESGDQAVSLIDRQARWIAEGLRLHSFGDYQVRQFVASEIVRAANDTGFPPDLLMAIAEQESSFDVNARPPKGSALGLMQFLEQTWLEAVSMHGREFGLADAAQAIKSESRGGRTVYFVDDPEEERRILEMRRSPYLSAAFAAKNLLAAKARIEARLDRDMEDDDIYLPHFLGAGGAGKLLAKVDEKPDAVAKKVFPEAARYNAGLFRGQSGKALTVRQLHERTRNIIASKVEKYRNVEQIIAEAEADMPETFVETPAISLSMLRR